MYTSCFVQVLQMIALSELIKEYYKQQKMIEI